MKTPASFLLLASLLGVPALAQAPAGPAVKFPAQSPASTVTQDIGLTKIEIVYSRPGVKGRQVIGGTEAFGRVWRTGANTATKITFSTPVKFGGADVPAGSYALYSIPGADSWTIILNKVTGQWGAYQYDEKNDLVRVPAKPVRLAEPVETFTIDLNDIRDQSATLNLIWERTKVPVKIEVDVASKVAPAFEQLAASGAKVSYGQYYAAAVFYHDNGLDLNKAREFIEKATNHEKPAYYMVHWKAKILARLGDKAGAKAAAEKSTELAVKSSEGPRSPFVKMNQDLIASLQ